MFPLNAHPLTNIISKGQIQIITKAEYLINILLLLLKIGPTKNNIQASWTNSMQMNQLNPGISELDVALSSNMFKPLVDIINVGHKYILKV